MRATVQLSGDAGALSFKFQQSRGPRFPRGTILRLLNKSGVEMVSYTVDDGLDSTTFLPGIVDAEASGNHTLEIVTPDEPRMLPTPYNVIWRPHTCTRNVSADAVWPTPHVIDTLGAPANIFYRNLLNGSSCFGNGTTDYEFTLDQASQVLLRGVKKPEGIALFYLPPNVDRSKPLFESGAQPIGVNSFAPGGQFLLRVSVFTSLTPHVSANPLACNVGATRDTAIKYRGDKTAYLCDNETQSWMYWEETQATPSSPAMLAVGYDKLPGSSMRLEDENGTVLLQVEPNQPKDIVYVKITSRVYLVFERQSKTLMNEHRVWLRTSCPTVLDAPTTKPLSLDGVAITGVVDEDCAECIYYL